jgi:L-amino acid N-acyltransferase YncA
MKIIVKQILEQHLKEAHELYNYYIDNSYANFEETEVSYKDFYNNYKNIDNNKLPYIVALDEKKVIGIAYLNKFRDKSGYRFVFENTIYVNKKYIKLGVGSKLLEKLLKISKKNKNIKKIVAVIGGIDSKGSLRIHQKFGFKKSGVLKKIGFKNNKWIDAILMQKNI